MKRNRVVPKGMARFVFVTMIAFSMFYHPEHRLFPAVPTIKLPEPARRIDQVLPELEKKNTF